MVVNVFILSTLLKQWLHFICPMSEQKFFYLSFESGDGGTDIELPALEVNFCLNTAEERRGCVFGLSNNKLQLD